MPLYEYECDANQHRFERIQKFSDALVTTCPICGSTVHKLFSSPAIQFKGTGWYITDYAKKAGDTKDTKETKDTKDSGGGKQDSTAETKSETKTETKAESKSESKSESKTDAKTETKS